LKQRQRRKKRESERRKKQVTTTHLTLFADLKQRSRIQESSAPLLFFATEMGLKISLIMFEFEIN
jgi:hypothetical protein